MNKKIRETEIPKFIKSEKNTAKEFEVLFFILKFALFIKVGHTNAWRVFWRRGIIG